MDANARDRNGACPACEAEDVISISMTVGESDLSFSTCHRCEAKWWHRDGRPVALDSVLEIVGNRP